MKANRISFAIICILVSISLIAGAQTNAILGRFIAQEKQGIVYLNWQILAGSTCNGIKLYRSADSINFTEIGRIDGVCGDISVAESYNFTDPNPYPSINYYQLELGIGNFSEIISIEIIQFDESSYQIRPNPVINFARIYFNNENHDQFSLMLHDITGKKVIDLSTREEYIELSARDLNSGMYIITILNPAGQSFESGKIIVR